TTSRQAMQHAGDGQARPAARQRSEALKSVTRNGWSWVWSFAVTRSGWFWVSSFAVLLGVCVARGHAAPAEGKPSSAAAPQVGRSAGPGTVVATVGPMSINQDELDQRATEMEQSYEQHTGRPVAGAQHMSLRRQALETLVRQRLFKLEADRAHIAVP